MLPVMVLSVRILLKGGRLYSGCLKYLRSATWRRNCYWPARGRALISACPNNVRQPHTSSVFICHPSTHIRSHEGVCAQRTRCFASELALIWTRLGSFFLYFALKKACKFQTFVSDCATASAIWDAFTRHWFVGNLTCSGAFSFSVLFVAT